MAFWSRFTDFIRDTFNRDQSAREQAAGDVDLGDYPVDLFGNLSVQAMGHGLTQDHLMLNNALMARFVDYEMMDEYPDCSAALNIYSDDATVIDTTKKHVMWSECKDENTRLSLDTMLHKRVKVDDEAWESIRMLSKYGNCLRADTRVWTDQGLVEIQHIEPGMQVVAQTEDGQYTLTRVVKKYDNGVKPTFRVRTRHRELFLTANHRVRIEQPDGSSAWVEVRDLQCGRYPSSGLKATNSKLVLGTRMPEGRVPNWDELFGENDPLVRPTGEKGTPNEVRLPSSPEPWFLRLFGFLLGDGWIASATTTSQVCFALGELEDQNQRYEHYFSKLRLVATRDRYGRYAYVSSVRLEAVLRAIGWLDGSGGKRVPSWVYSLPEEHRREFLLGFIDADGWITEPKTRLGEAYHFEVSNYDLARDLKQLIDGLGLRSGNLRERTREPGFEIQGKIVKSARPSYTLTFDLTRMDGPFAAERVVSIEPDGEHQVYDIEVEDESHSFVADGVVVHNCFEEVLVNDKGVQGLNYLPAPTIRRLESDRGALKGFVQSFRGNFQVPTKSIGELKFQRGVGKDARSGVVLFEPWRIVHMRLRHQRRRAMYGIGILEPARWVWRRLTLLEDAALISRLARAPSRFAFYVDVGKLPSQKAEKYLDEIRRKMKKRKFVNPKTGKLDLRYNPLCLSGDTEIPLLGGRIVPLRQLVEEHEGGRVNWVYSIDRENGNAAAPGKIVWAGGTRKNARMVEVTLDNGKTVRCTPDHKWMMRDGEYREAQHLQTGDPMMSWWKDVVSSNEENYVKVASVQRLEEREDTFTLTVEKHHNFAVASGCYVKNSTDEDFFLPVRESREIVRADVLNTPQWTGVEDIEYFRNKLHAALMVPKAYLGYDENMPSRATLSQEDVRFARSVLRLQKEYRSGIMQVCRVHLASQGIDPHYVGFSLAMTVPSSIFELAQLEVQNTRAQFAQVMGEIVSKHWILSKVFGFSDAEIEEVMKQRDEEAKAAMAMQSGGGSGGRFESAIPLPGTTDQRVHRNRILTNSRLYPLEQDLFSGNNPPAQRRLEDNMTRLLHENRTLGNQLAQVTGFMGELRGMMRSQPSL